MTDPVLSVQDLTTEFRTEAGVVHAVDGVSYDVYAGETLGVVGESGSGKSVTVLSVLGLIPQPPGRIVGGHVFFEGRDLLRLGERELRRIRGKEIAMVFQDAMTSLNPVLRVGDQVSEAIRTHNRSLSEGLTRARAVELLEMVGVGHAAQRYGSYPHEYSGGMRQRAMIAMAVANRPKVLIADEPTTALDVTIQAQVLDVLAAAQREADAATILITHDLGLIAEMADRVVVMYAGKVVEIGDVHTIFGSPRHPYTVGLMASLPHLDVEMQRLSPIPGQPPSLLTPPPGCSFHPRCRVSRGRERCREEEPALYDTGKGHRSACHFHDEVPADLAAVEQEIRAGVFPRKTANALTASEDLRIPGGVNERSAKGEEILRVEQLVKHFEVKSGLFRRQTGTIKAVDNVSFALATGETLGLVGESGCGKSTTARALMRLVDPTSGQVWFKGHDITGYTQRQMRAVRREIQMVFQDPYASLNPRMTVRSIVAEPLRIHGRYQARESRARVAELLELVGLNAEHGSRFPHEFSGGQRQRIGIARALALDPQLLILDEPVSALDVSIQAQVINLLQELQDELGVAYLFIAHDLSVVRHICDRVAVMYLGRIVEIGTREQIYQKATHPYTQALLSAVPIPDPYQRGARERIMLHGDPPHPVDSPRGCNFRTRCFKSDDRCVAEDPELADRFGHGHPSACHYAEARRLLR